VSISPCLSIKYRISAILLNVSTHLQHAQCPARGPSPDRRSPQGADTASPPRNVVLGPNASAAESHKRGLHGRCHCMWLIGRRKTTTYSYQKGAIELWVVPVMRSCWKAVLVLSLPRGGALLFSVDRIVRVNKKSNPIVNGAQPFDWPAEFGIRDYVSRR
jgi:hypothetical protein